MPSSFDRFRLLNGTPRRIVNESEVAIYLRANEEDDPVIVPPGVAAPLPESAEGETIVDVAREE